MTPTNADSSPSASADEGRYAKRGVSASKAEVHEAIKGMDKGLFPNAFCKVLPDLAGGDPDWANCIHADTAGTKTSLAYLYWRETGDESVWAGIAQDALVMNLDDMACIGAVDRVLISSTIGRNKHRIPGSVIAALIQGTNAFLDRMRDLGVDIAHGGGETADVGDIVRTVDVGFTAFARLPREQVLVNHIQPGDAIVALASYGQASYEDRYNGGMGSNGLTSARHDLFGADYAERFPESFDPETDRSVVYTGPYRLTDPVPADLQGAQAAQGLNMGQLVLSPTRTYLPFIARALKEHRPALHGMIHCTGGAQTKVLHFAEGVRIIKDKLLPIPPLFHAIQRADRPGGRIPHRCPNHWPRGSLAGAGTGSSKRQNGRGASGEPLRPFCVPRIAAQRLRNPQCPTQIHRGSTPQHLLVGVLVGLEGGFLLLVQQGTYVLPQLLFQGLDGLLTAGQHARAYPIQLGAGPSKVARRRSRLLPRTSLRSATMRPSGSTRNPAGMALTA
jgi:phosphoribosylformylglycinamidine cyclo-ligase